MNEISLVEGLKAGKEESYKQLMEEYQVPLMKLCIGFLHQADDASDVVQDTFIEVFESIHKFRADSRISTWLYRIAVNKSLNFLRKKKNISWLVNPLRTGNNTYVKEGPQTPADESANADYGIEHSEKKKLLKKAVDSLPENQRIAFILNKYQGLAYSEVAEVMAISISSTESLIHRAKKGLQSRLYNLYKKNLI